MYIFLLSIYSLLHLNIKLFLFTYDWRYEYIYIVGQSPLTNVKFKYNHIYLFNFFKLNYTLYN